MYRCDSARGGRVGDKVAMTAISAGAAPGIEIALPGCAAIERSERNLGCNFTQQVGGDSRRGPKQVWLARE